MYPSPIQKQGLFLNVSYRVCVVLLLALWVLPLVAVMLTSIRSIGDINSGNYWGIPSDIQLLENYGEVFVNTPILTYFLNSLKMTLPATFITIFISAMAGYALAFHSFKLNIVLFAMFIAGNFVPPQILMIPVRDLVIKLGIYDTLYSLIFFHTAFQSGFCTFFLRNFMKTVPFSLVENARMEGASEQMIFFRIILPLIRPSLAALGVLIFTFIWNDFFWALTLVQSDKVRPITVGLQTLRGQWTSSWNLISAGSLIAALPPVIMFFLMQKHFINGLTLGANKG